jgi:hypothetical protein
MTMKQQPNGCVTSPAMASRKPAPRDRFYAGYFRYKQVARAGQPGMAVDRATAMDSTLALIAFARNGTRHPDAFVLVNLAKDKKVAVRVNGSAAKAFTAFRTSGDQQEQFASLGLFSVREGVLVYDSPGGSVTTFLAEP